MFESTTRAGLTGLPVLLPPLDEQRRIVTLIAAVDEAIEVAGALLKRTASLYGPLIDEVVDGVSYLPLADLASLAKAGGTPSRGRPEFYDGKVPWLKSGEVNNPLIMDTEEHLSAEGLRNSSAWIAPQGAVVVAMYGATAGQVGRLGQDMATNQAVLALLGGPALDTGFLFHWLRSRSSQLKSRAIGAAQPNLSKERVLSEPTPALPIDVQISTALLLDEVLAVAGLADRSAERLRTVRSALLDDVLSGDHEIPESYDELLTA